MELKYSKCCFISIFIRFMRLPRFLNPPLFALSDSVASTPNQGHGGISAAYDQPTTDPGSVGPFPYFPVQTG